MEFKYRGFTVRIKNRTLPSGRQSPAPMAEIDIFDSNSNQSIGCPCIELKKDFQSYSQTELEIEACKRIDQEITLFGYRKNRADSERKNIFLDKLIQSIEGKGQKEALSDKLLYDKLKAIGMTPLDIIACGHKELVPFFDRETYAKTIADRLIFLSAENTSNGSWVFDFDVIENMFAVDLSADGDMLKMVTDALYEQSDILSEIQIYDKQIDLMLYLAYCPYVDDVERWGDEDAEPENDELTIG